MNSKDFNTKKIKTISVASTKATKEECLTEFFLQNKNWTFYDPILNQKIAQWFHAFVEKLKTTENINPYHYRIAHRFVWSSEKGIPRDRIDKRIKKALVELLESHGVYPYTR